MHGILLSHKEGKTLGRFSRCRWTQSICHTDCSESERERQLLYINACIGNLDGEGNGNPLQHSCLANPMGGGALWAAVHGVAKSWTQLSDFPFTFHFHALEKEMATHSSVLACRIPEMGEPWRAAVSGVAQSRTRLKQLSSSSSREFGKLVLRILFAGQEYRH